jgi:hypothetical protein
MIGRRPGIYWIICWRYLSPLLIVVSIIAEFYTKSLIDYIIWIVPLSLRNIHNTGDDNTVVTKLIIVLVTNIGFSMMYHRVIVVHGNCQQTSSYIMTTSFTENWYNKWKLLPLVDVLKLSGFLDENQLQQWKACVQLPPLYNNVPNIVIYSHNTIRYVVLGLCSTISTHHTSNIFT